MQIQHSLVTSFSHPFSGAKIIDRYGATVPSLSPAAPKKIPIGNYMLTKAIYISKQQFLALQVPHTFFSDERNPCIVTVWIVEKDQEGPKLVTAYPA
mgnify:CR=1 FL=1